MKKKLAILFASMSLCACGFIGCGDDDNDESGKLGNGEACQKNDDCDSAFCQKDGDKKVCAAKIANDGECKNADDICATSGYKCQGEPLKCVKGGDAAKAKENEKCGTSANGIECEANLKCEKKGGEEADKDDMICKKSESGAKAKENEKCGESANGIQCEDENTLECVKKDGAADYTCQKKSQAEQPLAYNQACDVNNDKCGEGLKCEANVCKKKSGTACATGENCVEGFECKAGDGADTDLKCREVGGNVTSDKLGKGALCGNSATGDVKQCKDGLICWKRGGNGSNSDETICKIKAGEACNESGDDLLCLNGTECKGTAGQKKCEKPAELNAECVVFTGCGGDYYCAESNNACQNKLVNGDVCYDFNNSTEDPGRRNDKCLSGHCAGSLAANPQHANDFEFHCADKVAAGATCTRLLLSGGTGFAYTSICEDGYYCRPESYVESFNWEVGKCLPLLLQYNEPCNTPRENIEDENECDWTWGTHLICHHTDNGNLCKVANGGACSKNEHCASGFCGTGTERKCEESSD